MSSCDGAQFNNMNAKADKLRYSRVSEGICMSGRLSLQADFAGKIMVRGKVAGDEFYYDADVTSKKKSAGGHASTVEFRVVFPDSDIVRWHPDNDVFVCLNEGGETIPVQISMAGRTSPIKRNVINSRDGKMACHFKETLKHLRIQVREPNVTDAMWERVRIAIAYGAAKISRKKNTVLLYEKFCSSYEESASVLFEKLVDSGYKNARFILDENYHGMKDIDQKYRKYIIRRFSMKHYYSLFTAKSLLSSEAVGHVLEKRCASRLFNRQVRRGYDYAFLQHGVMYMVSLGSEQRDFYGKSKSGKKQRVVVSSQLEADHFTENTEYGENDIYLTGLAKFDRSILNEDADRITIIPTWRPWENVVALEDEKSSTYYRMLKNMIECIPGELRDKLIVMPHPRMSKQNESEDNLLWQYYMPDTRYEDVLRMTKLLITDYSSISYDAFYRGANVAFFWGEKDECMKHYGNNSKLMLTEELAFGPVSYDYENLRKAISELYNNSQKQQYVDNYRKIVEFHDGKNTERIIERLKKDGMI